MKKKYTFMASVLMLALMAGCGKEDETTTATTTEATTEATEQETTEEVVGGDELANPWVDITEEEAVGKCPRLFAAPEGAENVKWSYMDDKEKNQPIVQLVFTMDGTEYTERAQMGGEAADISGMYYDWTHTEDVTYSKWGDGNMTGKVYSYAEDDVVKAMMATGFDVEIGINYSLSATGDDLNGLDIQAVMDQTYIDRDAAEGSIKVKGSDDSTEAVGGEEDGQNPVMNIIGKYGCDRATMTIECQGKDEAKINVTWGGSASECAEWNMVGVFDTTTNTVNYKDCEKKVVTYGEDGNVQDEKVEYTDGTGSIKVNDDYSLTWTDDKEHIADGSKFVFAN